MLAVHQIPHVEVVGVLRIKIVETLPHPALLNDVEIREWRRDFRLAQQTVFAIVLEMLKYRGGTFNCGNREEKPEELHVAKSPL